MFKPTSPENAEIIRKLQAALCELPMNSVIDYSALRKVAGIDVRARRRHLLIRAVELAERELGCAFACVRNEGIKRLLSAEAPNVGLHALRKCRSASRKGKRRLDRLNGNSMTEGDQRKTRGYIAMLGAIHLLADARKAKAVAAVADPVKPIPPANILEMFRNDDA